MARFPTHFGFQNTQWSSFASKNSLHVVLLCFLGWISCSLLHAQETGTHPVSLGKLEPFWRYSAALGPFLESGYPLVEIPDYMQRGDFPYRKRPYPLEVPFADHLSIVRLLGGCNSASGKEKAVKEAAADDLAYRDTNGKIRYRMELLRPRLQPYLDNGYTSLTLVLDNIPWCFPETPKSGSSLGQSSPPRDPVEWRDFITALCLELKNIMGPDAAKNLRFRVGTENNGTARFDGTQAQFERHYNDAAAAVQEVLPGAAFGPFNISGASVRAIDEKQNVNAFELARNCFAPGRAASPQNHVPFDWVAFSRYYRPGNDPDSSAQGCREIWNEFGRRQPLLKNVSREIHEFGIAPFGEVEKGQFASAEPGALGAALTAQMMWRLKEAGINRLWHWLLQDKFRDRSNNLQTLFTSQAWILSIMEYMVGGDTWLFSPLETPPSHAKYLMAGSFQNGGALLMISAYNTDISNHAGETVQFLLPPELLQISGKTARFVQLTRQTSIFDKIRLELETAGMLNLDFTSQSERLGSVREMVADRQGEQVIADLREDYIEQWVDSLTLKPLDPTIGKIENNATGTLVSVHLSAPEVLVIELK